MATKVDVSKLSKKDKVRWAVQEYIKLFPDEYVQFKLQMKQTRESLLNDWAETNKDMQVVERLLFEVPEAMYFGFKKVLKKHEFDWLYGLNDFQKKDDGPRWFFNEFEAFRVTKQF